MHAAQAPLNYINSMNTLTYLYYYYYFLNSISQRNIIPHHNIYSLQNYYDNNI